MAFRAIIHAPAQEKMQEIYKVLAQYRSEKVLKYIGNLGVTSDILQDILQQDKIHITDSKAS